MADRPILFSAPMVRAILREIENPGMGKTQTRRILKPLPNRTIFFDSKKAGLNQFTDARYKRKDRLWVREAWRCNGWATDVATIFYAASEGDGYTAMCEQYPAAGKKPVRVTHGWRPSIHMPRWASRITLIVTNVRVERLQDITNEDAIAEGLLRMPFAGNAAKQAGCDWGFDGDPRCGSPVSAYAALWEQINGPRSWEANPWIVAYTFRPILGNIDQIGGQDG